MGLQGFGWLGFFLPRFLGVVSSRAAGAGRSVQRAQVGFSGAAGCSLTKPQGHGGALGEGRGLL